MSFSESYKRDNEKITPDNDFIDDLEKKMNIRKANLRHRRIMMTSFVSVAAVFIIVLAVNVLTADKSEDISLQAGSMTTVVTGNGSFTGSQWYGDAETDSEKKEIFLQLLNEQLKTLYCGTNEKFTDEDILSEDKTEVIVKKLMSAESSESSDYTDPVNYMAVFTDGKIIRFKIYNEKYLSVSGIDSIYEVN